MMLRHMLPHALLSAILLSGAPALAAQSAVRIAAAEAPEAGPSKADVKAFEQVKVPIRSAISAASKHSGDGKVTEASFYVRKDGRPAYRVKTYQNNEAWEGMIDAQTGEVIGAGKKTPEFKLDDEDKAELAGLRLATITLTQAVNAAETGAGGKAIAAGIEQTKGKIVFEVSVVKGGSVRKVVIDPQSGKVIN